ncbi:MAG: hypothetical protein MJA82_12950 [Clostridia bacterium]|nr:hypothetical protein [Clostridia bacterium]
MGMAPNNFEVYETKFNILGEKMNELKKRVNTFDKIKEVLVELKILTTQQIEANAQRDKILREHGIALAKAVEALNELGKKQDNHEARLVALNERLSENREKSSIDINEIIKKVIYIGIGAVVTVLLSGIIK